MFNRYGFRVVELVDRDIEELDDRLGEPLDVQIDGLRFPIAQVNDLGVACRPHAASGRAGEDTVVTAAASGA